MSPLDQPTGLLASLRAEVVARLTAQDPNTDPNAIPILDGGRSDILKAVTESLTKRTAGLCVVVTVPKVDVDDSATAGIRVTVSVMIYERPATNWSPKGRQQSIEDTWEHIMVRLCFADDGKPGWTPNAIWQRLRMGLYRIVYADSNQVVAEATFTTGTVLQVQITE